MAYEIVALEKANVAEVGDKYRIIKLGVKDIKKGRFRVGDELEIISRGFEVTTLRFTTTNRYIEHSWYLYDGTILERIKNV